MKQKKLEDLPDRISKMPDSVITRILSFMSTKDAVRTSVLAKRWRYSWTSIFSLIYLHDSSKGSLQEFTAFIDRTIVLNNSSVIYKFVLKSLYDGFMEPSVTCWVQAALSKQVDHLTLKFRNTSPPYFLLPQSIYECNSLTVLSISHCCIAPTQSSFFWRALKHLRITCAELSNNLLREILAGSPLLESLKLQNCMVFDNIDINSGRLKTMVINGYGSCRCNYREATNNGWLIINAPNLLFLEIKGDMNGKRCRLNNVASLAHAKFTFWLGYEGDEHKSRAQDCQNMVKDLMEKVGFAENLTVGSWLIQVLSTCKLKHLPIFSSVRKRLILETYLCGQDLPGIDALLLASPVIEQLVIDVSPSHLQVSDFEELCNINSTNYWNTQRIAVSHCLKTIKIVGFSKPVIELVKSLLENAKALDHMTFYKSKDFANGQRCFSCQEGCSFKILQNMLRFKRASPQAKIILEVATLTSSHQCDQSDELIKAPATLTGLYGNGITIQKRSILGRRSSVLSKEAGKKAEQDFISDLPDSILLQILTLLPLKDAMCTGLLSKRWKRLWASVPSLSFHFELSTFRNKDHFTSFVDKTLSLYNSPVIQRFSLTRFDWEKHKQNIDSWVCFAVDHRVKHSLICSFIRIATSYVDLITTFASCPVLERIELVKCCGFQNLDILNVGLKELVIAGDLRSWENCRMLRISAPYIKSLVITGTLGYRKLQTMNLSSLVEACLDFTFYLDDSRDRFSEERKTMVTDILTSVCHVEKLTLRTWCLQVFLSDIGNPVPYLFSVCKSLILKATNKTNWREWEIVGILHCCPELETLTIDMSAYYDFVQLLRYGFGHWYRSPDYDNINCLKQHLERVEIYGMLPDLTRYDFCNFIQELLKEAKVLKKLSVIKIRLWKDYMCSSPPAVGVNGFFNLGSRLLSSKRSSPLAEIELSSRDSF